jgi:ABC-type uncharacterized transport system ATPase component
MVSTCNHSIISNSNKKTIGIIQPLTNTSPVTKNKRNIKSNKYNNNSNTITQLNIAENLEVMTQKEEKEEEETSDSDSDEKKKKKDITEMDNLPNELKDRVEKLK